MDNYSQNASPKQWGPALAGIILLALAVRVLLVFGVDRTVWTDETSYLWLARTFLSGAGYTHYFRVPEVLYPPGYPLLAGLAYLLLGDLVLASNFWFVLAGTALAVPVFLLAKAIYGPRQGLVAVVLMAVCPALTATNLFRGTLSEPAYLFFLISSFYFAYMSFTRKDIKDFALAGLCLSAAYLTRFEGLLYFFLLLAGYAVVFVFFRKHSWRKALPGVVVFVVGFFLLAFPYLLYLNIVLGEWTLTAHGERTYVSPLATGEQDVIIFDRQQWGLDRYGREVRYYSLDIEEVPLMTRFFQAPGEFMERLLVNARRTFGLVVTEAFFGGFLLAFVPLGLFARPWKKDRAYSELFLVLTLLPLGFFWIYHVQERFLLPMVPVLILWSANGIYIASRWLQRTSENLWNRPISNTIAQSGRVFFFLILSGHLLLTVLSISMDPYPPTVYELKTVARWLHANVLPTSRVMSTQPAIAFHADVRWAAFPNAPLSDCLEYASRHHVDYWVLESDVIRTRRPHLIPLLEGRKSPDVLREVHRMEIPPNKTYVIMEMKDR